MGKIPLMWAQSLYVVGRLLKEVSHFKMLFISNDTYMTLTELVLLCYHPIFLRHYHFLKLVSFLGANRTKSAYVCPWLLRSYTNT